MLKSLIHQSAHPQAATGQGQDGPNLSELLKRAATIRDMISRPPQSATVAAQRALLMENLAFCVSLAGQPVVGQQLVHAAPVLLAVLDGYRWLQQGQGADAKRVAHNVLAAVTRCEGSLQFALRKSLQQVLADSEQYKAKVRDGGALAAPAHEGSTFMVLAHKLAELGHLADAISRSSHHIQAFTAANAAGHLVDKTLRQWAIDAPALLGLYAYRPKVGADFDRLDRADLPQTEHLPPMGFAIQPRPGAGATLPSSQADGDRKSKHVQVVGGRSYELQATLSDRTGMTGKVRLARAQEAPEQKWIAKVQSTHTKLIGSQKVQSHDLADILQRSDQAALAEAHLSAGLQKSRRARQTAAEEVMEQGQGRVQVADHFIDEFGKYYQIMPAMAGDLTDFAHAMGALVMSHPELQPSVTLACLMVNQQLFAQVAAMHARKLQVMGGMAHRDIKLNNIVFHDNGRVRLIDFDEAKALTLRGRNRGPADNAGTISSPERHLPGLLPNKSGSAKASDVWNAGVTALAMLSERAGAPVGGPLMRANYQTPHGRITVEAFFLTYQAWWHMRVQGGPKVLVQLASLSANEEQELTRRVRAQLQKLQQAEGRVFPMAFGASVDETRALAAVAEEFTTYANDHLQLQPKVATLLFRDALAPVPKARSSAASIHRALAHELSQATPEQRSQAESLFARAAGSTPLSD